MPTRIDILPSPERRQAHLKEARSNRALALDLVLHHPNDPAAVKWAVTVAFYAAMHCMQAHLVDRLDYRDLPRTHKQRWEVMQWSQADIPFHILSLYRTLREWSEQGRYNGRTFTTDDVHADVFGKLLEPIAEFVGLDSPSTSGGPYTD